MTASDNRSPDSFSVGAPIYPLHNDDNEEEFVVIPAKKKGAVALESESERCVFLCYKDPQSWPARVEASESDRLPRFLNQAIKASVPIMSTKTRLTLCEGRDGTDSSNGDVLIFPDMVRYKGLTHFDVDTFVEEVLVKNKEWLSGNPEKLSGVHVFICSHTTRNSRCGVFGPPLISLFKEEVAKKGLEGHVFVRACSHIGGHKYSGNVIIYGPNATAPVTGHCYGYATPRDVSTLLEKYLSKVAASDLLSSCEMEPEQGELKQLGKPNTKRVEEDKKCLCCHIQDQPRSLEKHVLCSSSKCSNQMHQNQSNKEVGGGVHGGPCKGVFGAGLHRRSAALEMWEKEDTWALLALVGAAVSVTLAYHLCKN